MRIYGSKDWKKIRRELEQLHLPLLSQALKNASSPKTYPMKKIKPRVARTELVPVRRSERFSSKPVTKYQEVTVYGLVQIPRRIKNGTRDILNRVYASDEARECAIKKADELESTLGSHYPSFVRSMLPSHVSGGFWLGLSSDFSKRQLPRNDGVILLIDEEGEEWPVVYLARESGLSGGWKEFAIDHHLVDGDALVFHLIRPTVLKIHNIVDVWLHAIPSNRTKLLLLHRLVHSLGANLSPDYQLSYAREAG